MSGSPPPSFCTMTVSSSPPAARTRYWIETPRNAATITVPRATLAPAGASAPAGTSVIFSGRTPMRTLAVSCGPMRAVGTCSWAPSWVSTEDVAPSLLVIFASIRFEMPRKLATNWVCGCS